MRSLLLLAAAGVHSVAAGTPVEKVITLLTKLENTVEEEGTQEAANYDKFACFCKDQADEKQYAIEKSTKKIDKLEAEIDVLKTEIKTHDDNVVTEQDKVTANEDESKTETAKRATENQTYNDKDQNLARAISATEGATAALLDHGGKQAAYGDEGGPQALPSFVQANVQKTLKLAQALSELLSVEQAVSVSHHLNSRKPKYQFHNKDVVAVLQGLTKTFKAKKDALFNAEANTKASFDQAEADRQHQIQVASRIKAENERDSEAKGASKQRKTDSKDAETNDRTADQDFQKNLTEQCESKAKAFDSRSQSRANELTALSGAVAALRKPGGATDTYGAANKNKLVLLNASQTLDDDASDDLSYLEDAGDDSEAADSDSEEAAEDADADDDDSEAAAASSFLQLRSAPERKAMKLLATRAQALKSPALAALSMQMSADHFGKVRDLIQDLIDRLEQQEKDEQTAQAACKDKLEAATTARDDSQIALEQLNGQIAGNHATISTLKTEIKDLQNEVAELNRALAEATELRRKENLAYEAQKTAGESGKAAVDEAIRTLEGYYGGRPTALLQQRQPTVHTADRSGQTFDELAPDTFDDNDRYSNGAGAKGNQGDHSHGIFSLLDVISTDYQRSLDQAKADEDLAQGEFDTFEKKANDDITEKNGSIDTKKGEKSDEEDDLEKNTDSHETETDKNKAALEKLAVLKASCIDTEISYEERVARREQEIQSLKDALQILGEMSFLQKRK